MTIETIWGNIQVFLAIVAPISFAETFLREDDKAKIAEYIFGFHNVNLRDFENGLTKLFVGVFFSRNKIRIGRLIALSLVLTSSAYILIISYGLNINQGGDGLLSSTWVFFLLAPASLPIDYLNILISRKIYSSKRLEKLPVTQLLLDFFLSIMASMIVLYAILALFGATFDPMEETYFDALLGQSNLFLIDFLWVLSTASLASIIAYFSLRIALLATGITLRILLKFTHLNRYLVLISDAHKLPMTFIASILALGYLTFT